MDDDMAQVMKELKAIREDIDLIKEHILEDTLTPEDIEAIREGEKEYREGKTISVSLEELERELENED